MGLLKNPILGGLFKNVQIQGAQKPRKEAYNIGLRSSIEAAIKAARKRRRRRILSYAEEPMTRPTQRALRFRTGE